MAKPYFSKVAGFNRSSHQRRSVKKGPVRKVFAKFTGKHLFQKLYFNKVAGLRVSKRKKRHWHRCFTVKFAKFLRKPFLQNSSRRLLLLLAFPSNFTKMDTANSVWKTSDEYSLSRNTHFRSTDQVYHFFPGSINFQCMFSLVYTAYCLKQPPD